MDGYIEWKYESPTSSLYMFVMLTYTIISPSLVEFEQVSSAGIRK